MTSPCDKLVQFDTEAMSSSLATLYSALQFVNSENYEEVKDSASAAVPGYFEGTYDHFKTQRNKLTQLFMSSGFTSLQRDYYRHTLSAVGAEAYAKCLAEQSQQPISAWISQRTENSLALMVRCGLPGIAKVNFTIIGAVPNSSDAVADVQANQRTVYELGSGGTAAFLFTHDKKKDFLIAINAQVPALNTSAASTVFLPAVRVFEQRKESKTVTTTVMVGAGGGGNTSGNRIARSGTLVAPEGYRLEPATLAKISETVLGGPGIRSYQVNWVNSDAEGVTRAMIGDPAMNSLDGNDGDTQGISEITYSVNAVRDYVVEV